MHPSATAFLPSLDARWADLMPSSAPETLEKGFPEEAAEQEALKKIAQDHEPLSKKIAETQEDQARIEAETEAQDQQETDSQEAQESREFQGLGPVPQSGAKRGGGIPRYQEGGRNPVHGPIALADMTGGPSVPKAIVKSTAPQTTVPQSPPLVSASTVEVTANTVVRNVPAAVLRALEVEASLELGGKSNSSSRSSQFGRSGKLNPTRMLAEAEARTLQGMTSLLAQRGGRLRVQLHPVQLGPIQMDVQVDGDRVQTVIETATRAASKILEASSSRLKSALEAQGYSLDRLEVRQQGASSIASEESETGSEESTQDDSRRTQEDGQSPRRWHTARFVPSGEEDVSFADIGNQEHAR